jgi:hypothetical protein
MPITADLNGKQYTLGRGRVFFDRFPQGEQVTVNTKGSGERYIGNTPEFSITSESEDLDHFDSDAGVNTKDASVQLSLDRTGSFTTDSIDPENVALFFLGASGTVTQAAATGATESITVQAQGTFYQLGSTVSNPAGIRNISNVDITSPSGTVVDTDYQVEEANGRIYIIPGSTKLTVGTAMTVEYDSAATTYTQIVSSSDSVYGALRFVSTNPIGKRRHYYFPYVQLSPNGDYNLKGDEWQQISFTVNVLKKGTLESVYITEDTAT